MPTQRNRRLRNEVARVGHDLRAKFFNLGRTRPGPHQHPITTRFIRRLDHQLFKIFQNISPVFRLRCQISINTVENRILSKIIFNHLRYIIINKFVIRHTRTNAVGQRHVSGPGRINQSGHAQQRISAKNRGIQKIIVNPPVNHIDRYQSRRRTHVHSKITDDQITPLDNRDPHLASQKSMLEIRAVKNPRRQQHHIGVILALIPRRSDMLHRTQQRLRIIIHRTNPGLSQYFRKGPFDRRPVLQHVARPRRTPQIVLQYQIPPSMITNQISAANVNINVLRHLKMHELAPEMLRT